MGTYGTVRIESIEGIVEEIGLYFHTGKTWSETVSNAERVAKLQLGAQNVRRVLTVNGNAA